jgi:thioredoxin-dependent peroxiredoxin
MSTIMLHGSAIHTSGTLPAVGSKAPAFTLTKTDLSELSSTSLAGSKIILNIFPSIDTPVCATSTRKFNAELSSLPNTKVLCVSADLPFASGRFCTTEGLANVIPLSVFRHPEFGTDYGVLITDGALKGVLSRAIVVIDEKGMVKYTEQVPEIAQEPDYAKAIAAVK